MASLAGATAELTVPGTQVRSDPSVPPLHRDVERGTGGEDSRTLGRMPVRPILYTLGNCPTCTKAKRDLKKARVDYEERQVDSNAAWYEEALNYAATVPIYIDGDTITIGWKGEHG